MPRLRSLSGGDVLQILGDFGFEQSSQRGSHVKVRRLIAGQAHAWAFVSRQSDLQLAGTPFLVNFRIADQY